MTSEDKKDENKKVVVLILDGWGIAPPNPGNAITLAKTPNFSRLWRQCPHTQLCASGEGVGLPTGQDGNSEAGHINLGAGRVVQLDNVTISSAIADGTFFKNRALLDLVAHIKKRRSSVHLMGLLTNQHSGHANPDHIYALLDFLRQQQITRIFLHLFTDGRDSPQHEAPRFLQALRKKLTNHDIIVSVMGRFYAMDRKKAWERTEQAYNAMVSGQGRTAPDALKAICQAYSRGETDEYLAPTLITAEKPPTATIQNGDGIIFWNLRSDRARQITKPFVQKNFTGFKRHKVLTDLCFVALTDFGPDLDHTMAAFPSPDIKETLPFVLKNYRQLYLAEAEKFAHVTYFFNGGYKDPVAGEAREMVPSPDAANYDQTPGMSTKKIISSAINYLITNRYNFMVINIASPDMIAHTGNLEATIKAIEIVDQELGKLLAAIKSTHGILVVTADHGNAEELINLKTSGVNTDHSANPVPLIIFGAGNLALRSTGVLGDVAPTILKLIKLPKPKEMTGRPLF